MHKDIAIIIFYKDDKILVQDRRDRSKFGEEYGFFGGHVEASETPEHAVVRETKEELTYTLKEFEFLDRFHEKGKDFTFTLYVYITKCPSLNEFVQKEGQGMKMVTEEETKKLKMQAIDAEIIKKVFTVLRAGKNKLG